MVVSRLQGGLAPVPTPLQNPHPGTHSPDLHDAKSGLKPLGTGGSHGLPEGFPSDASPVTWAFRRVQKGKLEGGWSGRRDLNPLPLGPQPSALSRPYSNPV